ncbi:hypothetical protein BBJ28_00015659 [Nothophytophthora sp. Chile5]|nr:hypothetical protein BBJ28_00015659 [Nothophytophthora sp. Chile5]
MANRQSQQPDVRRLLKARRSEVAKVAVAALHKIVFDSNDPSAPYTLYTLKLRSETRTDMAQTMVQDDGKCDWKLRKRYSEFHALYTKLRRWKGEWEQCCLSNGDMFEHLTAVLQQAIGPEFPRKHVRYDTSKIIQERYRGLTDFIRVLLAVYTDLEVLLSATGNQRVRTERDKGEDEDACLRQIFLELERFLEIPPKRKELEARLTRAVLALKDATAVDKTTSCCICLSESDPSGAEGDDRMVRLPCSHGFHEDCVISWFHCSATCPICRQGVASTGSGLTRRMSIG